MAPQPVKLPPELLEAADALIEGLRARPDLTGYTRATRSTVVRLALLDAYYAAKKAIEVEYGVEIDSHGSDGWAVPIVKVAGVGHTARRGYPVKLDPSALAVDPAWDGKLARFCADLGIDTSEAEGPGWFLTSWWG